MYLNFLKNSSKCFQCFHINRLRWSSEYNDSMFIDTIKNKDQCEILFEKYKHPAFDINLYYTDEHKENIKKIDSLIEKIKKRQTIVDNLFKMKI